MIGRLRNGLPIGQHIRKQPQLPRSPCCDISVSSFDSGVSLSTAAPFFQFVHNSIVTRTTGDHGGKSDDFVLLFYLTPRFLPPLIVLKSSVHQGLERVKGIEPSYAAWEAAVLPLNYTRNGDALIATKLRRRKFFVHRGIYLQGSASSLRSRCLSPWRMRPRRCADGRPPAIPHRCKPDPHQ